MKLKSSLFAAAIALAGLSAQAQVNYAISGSTAYVASSPNASGNVVITNIYDGYPVTSIGVEAFDLCYSLTNIAVDAANPNYSSTNGVLFDKDQAALIQYPIGLTISNYTIPNSVTSIGDYAFESCSLTNVTIGNSVTSIGQYAFVGCAGLTNVTIGNSVTNIGDDAFNDCQSLTNVTIPDSVTSIGVQAFAFCRALTGVTIGNSVTSIGVEAFFYCFSLTSVTIPNSVTSIGYEAFDDTSLTSVTIPDSVTSIGDEAFVYSGLTSAYFQGNAPPDDGTVFLETAATVYYLPGTTGWGPTFGGVPTAPWTLPYPLILNHNPGFGVQNNQFGFTVSWATNLSIVVETCTNLANPVWTPIATNALASGTNYFSDPKWTNFPMRFYRAVGAFTVGGTVTGLAAWDSITLRDNGGDDLTLSTNGTFTFATPLADGQTYSVTLYTTSGQVACTFANGSGTISGANVTNVAVSCHDGCPALTGNRDLDMYNAAVSDGTANGGVPAVMFTENGGPFRVTAEAYDECSIAVAEKYPGWAVFTYTVGSNSCSSTTFPSGTPVIQFGTLLECGFGPYGY